MKFKVKGFKRGGVHPHDMKNLSKNAKITRIPLPQFLTIPLSQHIGAPAVLSVAVGDSVTIGQKIAEPASFVSAAIHSPVDAIVKEIKEVILPNGIKSSAIVLECNPEQNEVTYNEVSLDTLSNEEISNRIIEGGIVGSGGATFPTHIKLMVPKGKKAHTLIINAVECEPYLNADNRLMQEMPFEILKGLQTVVKLVAPSKIIIGIENNKPEAIAIMKEAILKENLPYEVMPLRVRYPQGDEKQLIQAVTNKELLSGSLPIDMGCIVINVGTLFAIYEAVLLNKPFYERVISVTGSAIKNPSQFLVPVGVPFSHLIEQTGTSHEVAKWVVGGPMMGFSFYDLESTWATKGSSGLLGLTLKETGKSNQTACLNCGRCISVCPMGLQPTKLFKYSTNKKMELALNDGLLDCKECGSCAYICPAKVPLVQGFKFAKAQARMAQAK